MKLKKYWGKYINIISQRLRNGKPEYLVKWKDWDKP